MSHFYPLVHQHYRDELQTCLYYNNKMWNDGRRPVTLIQCIFKPFHVVTFNKELSNRHKAHKLTLHTVPSSIRYYGYTDA